MERKSLISGIVLTLLVSLFFAIPGFAKDSWETILQKARKEGEVAVSGVSIAAGLKRSINLFKEKFGINMLITTGRTSSMAPKLLQERRTGLYLQDVMISGQSTMADTLKPAGAFDPLEPYLMLPEVMNQKLWYGGKFYWADEERYIFNFALYPIDMVFINTNLVKPDEIKSYYDLLKPEWKNKILINDPTTAGIASISFNAMLYNSFVTQDFFRKLVAQNNMMTRNQDLQATWLAKGKYPIALWPSSGPVARFIGAGAPIRPNSNMKEGSAAGSAGSGLSVFNKAPHPNAAKVFINWFLSREGQEINQEVVRKQTRRLDVPPVGLGPYEQRISGVKYFPLPDEKEKFILTESKKYKKLAKELFAPLK
ncbi:MAG: extracellular solute-binding protein [Desulfobacterales bacterium]|nr:extracellular solute-binding protein [Desulfobacterales bacterium]